MILTGQIMETQDVGQGARVVVDLTELTEVSHLIDEDGASDSRQVDETLSLAHIGDETKLMEDAHSGLVVTQDVEGMERGGMFDNLLRIEDKVRGGCI